MPRAYTAPLPKFNNTNPRVLEGTSPFLAAFSKNSGGYLPGACTCRALEVSPSVKPYLWQRGLSLYYAEEYEKAAQQFRDDVAVNPNDTEEAIWAYLSECQTLGIDAAREKLLQVLPSAAPSMRTCMHVLPGCFISQLESPGECSCFSAPWAL